MEYDSIDIREQDEQERYFDDDDSDEKYFEDDWSSLFLHSDIICDMSLWILLVHFIMSNLELWIWKFKNQGEIFHSVVKIYS